MPSIKAKSVAKLYSVIKDPILDKYTGLVPVMHARGTSGSAKWICCIGK